MSATFLLFCLVVFLGSVFGAFSFRLIDKYCGRYAIAAHVLFILALGIVLISL